MSFARMRNMIFHLMPKIYEHPFNRDLYQGTLPRVVFRSYLKQDALYLQDFSRALFLISYRLKKVDMKYAEEFKRFSNEIRDTEFNFHLKYLGETSAARLFKLPPKKSPTISEYTNHLLKTAAHSSIEEAVASLAPCFWIYSELGRKMPSTPNHPYHLWISSYSNAQFASSTQSIIQILEGLSKKTLCLAKQDAMVSAFSRSTNYEIAFWDSVYKETNVADSITKPLQQGRNAKDIAKSWGHVSVFKYVTDVSKKEEAKLKQGLARFSK